MKIFARFAIVLLWGLIVVARPDEALAYTFTKPVTLIYPYGVGGAADAYLRMISEALKNELGVPVVVVNRVGGSGTVGMSAAARAAPDGYTILMCGNTLIFGQYIYDLDFKPFSDLVPIGQFAEWGNTLTVRSDIPASTPLEYFNLAEEKPDTITFGGSAIYVFYQMASMSQYRPKAKLRLVPFRSEGEVFTALLGGNIDSMLAFSSTAVTARETGKLRLIATTAPHRSPLLPDVPTVAETIPGYADASWFGFFAPAGTPQEIIDAYYTALSTLTKRPATREAVTRLGIDTLDRNGAQLTQFLHEEDAKFAAVDKVVKLKSIMAQ